MTAGETLGCFDVLRGPVAWRPFGPDVFEAARMASTPVFLVIGAAWCPYSQRLLHWLHDDPEAVAALTDAWLPVLVDADVRPDVHAAYSAGGWPTIALLDPRGDPAWRGTHVPRDQVAGFLRAMAPVAAGNAPIEVDVIAAAPGRRLIDRIRSVFEREAGDDGGTDPGPAFPHLDAIETLLAGDEADQALGLTALRTRLNHLWDTPEGGLCRQAGPGWVDVHRAKLLADQASWISALVTAVGLTAAADVRAALRAAVDWCDTRLGDASPGFAASIRPGHPDVPPSWPVPRVDRRRFIEGNARMASALLKAAAALDADALRRRALFLLDALTLSPGGGDCAFLRRGTADDAALLLALADAIDYDGPDPWQARADALAAACAAHQGDPRAPAAAAPRAGGPARMQRLPTDVRVTAVWAEALHRVADGDAARRRRARRALQALTPAARLAGLAGARAALARRRLGLPDA